MASDNAKIAFGVVAAAGVVLVSYAFFRIFGTKTNDRPCSKRRTRTKKSQPASEGKVDDASTSRLQRTEAGKVSAEDPSEDQVLKEDSSLDTSSQMPTSYVHIDHITGKIIPGYEGPPSSRKSDKSSDESSFDVVEAGGEEEDDEERKHQDATLPSHSLDGLLTGDNESSMVIVETDPNATEGSSSSFYHSADETLSKDIGDSQGKKMVQRTGKGTTKDEPELSSSESEATVMYSMEGKKTPKGRDSDISDVSRTSAGLGSSTVKDSLATGDEKTMAVSDTETNSSLAVKTGEAGESLSEKVAALTPSPTVFNEEKGKQAALQSQKVLTSQETARTLAVCQNSASTVSKADIYNLVELLKAKNPSLREAVVDCVVRVSVFTHNNNHLHDAGCGWVLCQQVMDSCKAALLGNAMGLASLESLSDALTNLSMGPTFQSQLEETVSPLIDVFLLESQTESVQMSTLRPLTNFSSESTHHQLYKKGIHKLYALLDKGSEAVRVQCLKVLVNLSLNPEIVPYLLSAKAPSTLLDLMEASAKKDLVLRMVTMLGNIYGTMSSAKLSQSSLPTDEKVESPSTMYTALCGVAEQPALRNKVYLLTRHQNKDVSQQASKLYHFITEVKK